MIDTLGGLELLFKSMKFVSINGKKGQNLNRSRLNSPGFHLTDAKMRCLFQIYQSLALACQHNDDPLIVASIGQLQNILWSIPNSDRCNPMKDVPDESITDWEALR